MADGLAKDWSKLKLTDDEDVVVVATGKKAGVTDRRISLSLAGRLMTQKPFNIKAFKETIEKIWKTRKGLVIKNLDANTFIFQFISTADRQYVLDHEPWSFDNHLLVLQEIKGEQKPGDLCFDKAKFWVKAFDVPFGARDQETAKLIGDRIGGFLEYDQSVDFGWEKAMNIRVLVDITRPLRRGMKMAFDDIGEVWVPFKYRFLPNYCYACGLIGHLDRECETFGDEEIKSHGLQYGPWLRATPNKLPRRQLASDREKEKRLFAELTTSPAPLCKKAINFEVEKESTDESTDVGVHSNECEGAIRRDEKNGKVDAVQLALKEKSCETPLSGCSSEQMPKRKQDQGLEMTKVQKEKASGDGHLPNMDSLSLTEMNKAGDDIVSGLCLNAKDNSANNGRIGRRWKKLARSAGDTRKHDGKAVHGVGKRGRDGEAADMLIDDEVVPAPKKLPWVNDELLASTAESGDNRTRHTQ